MSTTSAQQPEAVLGYTSGLTDALRADDASGAEVARRIERFGWCCLSDVVTDEWIRAAVDETRLPSLLGTHEVILDDLESDPDSFAYPLANSADIRHLLQSVTAAAAPNLDAGRQRVSTSLRIIVGEDPVDRPPNFHYDRSVVTLVIPVLVPAGRPGASGELILVPNRRRFRRLVATNAIEKAIVQTGAYRRRFARSLPDTTQVVPIGVGNAYLFWGYRSYHTTLPCPPDSVRATVVMHFGELHHGSRLLTMAKTCVKRLRAGRDVVVLGPAASRES